MKYAICGAGSLGTVLGAYMRYHPISKTLLLDQLEKLEYGEIEERNYPAMQTIQPGTEPDWYCVIARKGKANAD